MKIEIIEKRRTDDLESNLAKVHARQKPGITR